MEATVVSYRQGVRKKRFHLPWKWVILGQGHFGSFCFSNQRHSINANVITLIIKLKTDRERTVFPIYTYIIFRCNMWMLLIVKLLSFKRYNYPFYKCRENGQQVQCAYSQRLNDKVVPLLFSLRLLIPRNKCKTLNQRMLQLLWYITLIFGCKGTILSWNKRRFIS